MSHTYTGTCVHIGLENKNMKRYRDHMHLQYDLRYKDVVDVMSFFRSHASRNTRRAIKIGTSR